MLRMILLQPGSGMFFCDYGEADFSELSPLINKTSLHQLPDYRKTNIHPN
jgi:hypothetical protein